MKRRSFLTTGMAAGLAPLSYGAVQNNKSTEEVAGSTEELVIEKFQSGLPHQGKVLAAIQPHCDDIPIFAGGTVAKLIKEGYTGYLIRTTNDDHAGRGGTIGNVVLNNEKTMKK